MAGSSLGKNFVITNFGESHGHGIGVVIDGCPSRIQINEEEIQVELDKRKPGQSSITTPRKESDKVQILSGVLQNKTTGAPILLFIANENQRSQDYNNMADLFRPSHADYTYFKKYGIRDVSGGGRSSARATAGNVAAGVIAKKILKHFIPKLEVISYVKSVKDIISNTDTYTLTSQHIEEEIEKNIVRCPDQKIAKEMIAEIEEAKKQGDSLGGAIECIVRNCPVGLGEPIFDKLEADLAKAILSINACKGFEIGSGFEGTKMKGSEHNDIFINEDNQTKTETNYSGGIQGGISNGMPIIFRCAFKPTATILREQKTVDKNNQEVILNAKGRHDPCVLPRAVPIVNAMTWLVLCDHFLRDRSILNEQD